MGTFVTNYTVIDSEYTFAPADISCISSASGVFSQYINNNVYITPSNNKPSRIVFIIYSDE